MYVYRITVVGTLLRRLRGRNGRPMARRAFFRRGLVEQD